MNFVKATAIAFIVAICAALMIANANAQSPSAAPTTQAEAGAIPEEAPPGWDQAAWTAIRENCERNLLEMARRARLTAAQRSLLPPLNFSHGDMMLCAHLSVRPQTSLQPSTVAPPRGRGPHAEADPTPARPSVFWAIGPSRHRCHVYRGGHIRLSRTKPRCQHRTAYPTSRRRGGCLRNSERRDAQSRYICV